MRILFARAVITSTAHASSVSPSSYRSTVFNQSALCVLFIFTCPPRQDKINNFAWLISWLTPLWRGETQTCFTFVISFSYFPICHFRFPIIRVTRRVQFFISAVLLIVEWSMSYLPGPSRRLEPVIKCSPFPSMPSIAMGNRKQFQYLQTNRFHVAVRLYSNRSQMTSKCGKNKKVAHEA